MHQDPNDAKAWSSKGWDLGQLGKHKQAIECYNKALEIDPNDAKASFNKGWDLGQLRKHKQAIECYNKALEIDPNYAEAWFSKGWNLGQLRKHKQAIECYNKVIRINPNSAQAYAHKGHALLALRKYKKSLSQFERAREIFLETGAKADAQNMSRCKILATNALDLVSRLSELDQKLTICFKSRTITELRKKSLDISSEIENLNLQFSKKRLPRDVKELLYSKSICFTVLSNALSGQQVDLNKLDKTKDVFASWRLYTFLFAVNCIDTFVRILSRYENIEKIPKEQEKYALHILTSSTVLDGDLSDEIARRIKGEAYTLHTLPSSASLDSKLNEVKASNIEGEPQSSKQLTSQAAREPNIEYRLISQAKKEWVRFCLVQLDFSPQFSLAPQEFAYFLKDSVKIKKKVFQALDIAEKNKVDIICFPELSFEKEWVDSITNKYKDMIIIGGTYYDAGHNICPIILDGEILSPPYSKHRPSPFQSCETTGRGMNPGNTIYILQTACGRFSVLTCIDYADQSYRVCRYSEYGINGVDFIVNPCYDSNILRFQSRCNSDCEDNGVTVLQINRAPENGKFGETCIIAKEHETILERLQLEGFKPKDNIKYKLFRAEQEMLVILDFNIKITPPVSLPTHYTGRIKLSKERCYKYIRGYWTPISR